MQYFGFTCDICKCPSVPDAERTWVDDAIEVDGLICDACVCMTCRAKYQHIIDEGTDAFSDWLKDSQHDK